MNWLDLMLALILIVSVITSFRKGLSREVISLVSVCLALVLGFWFYGSVGGHLLPYLNSPAPANLIGFGIVFCGVMILGSLVSLLVGKFLKVTGLSMFDHLLGAGFGIVRGILVAVALLTGIMAFTEGDRAPDAVVRSRLAPYVLETARVAAAMAPYELKQGFRKNYSRVKTAWEKRTRQAVRSGPDRERAEDERQI
jgi:membrane protein required for colicin V production